MWDAWRKVWERLAARTKPNGAGEHFQRTAPVTQAAHLRRGRAAEDLAVQHLEKRGLTVLARNVRCRGGEVDLVVSEGRVLAFVEVRLRSDNDFGGAAASIDSAKQRRVVLAAQYWLAGDGRRYAQRPCRFDAVLMDRLEASRLVWVRGAFDAC